MRSLIDSFAVGVQLNIIVFLYTACIIGSLWWQTCIIFSKIKLSTERTHFLTGQIRRFPDCTEMIRTVEGMYAEVFWSNGVLLSTQLVNKQSRFLESYLGYFALAEFMNFFINFRNCTKNKSSRYEWWLLWFIWASFVLRRWMYLFFNHNKFRWTESEEVVCRLTSRQRKKRKGCFSIHLW